MPVARFCAVKTAQQHNTRSTNVPTPTEPTGYSKPNEPYGNTREDVPGAAQPREVVPEQESAPEHSEGACEDGVTDAADRGQSAPTGRPSGKPPTSRHQTRVDRASGTVHLLFGAVEDLLADLTAHGAPDGGVVRVERLVRNRADTMGGVATLGIAVTARRADEILSCWVIVARLGLDPWGRPVSGEAAQRAARRHHEAQRLIGALVADAGFDLRMGLYQLPEDCYTLAATCESLRDLRDLRGHPDRPHGEEPHGEEQAPKDRGGDPEYQAEREENEEREESVDEGDAEEQGGGHDA
jgi:hypothetical protein